MTVFHDEIEIEDFEYDEEEEIYYYPCPCGDRFQISKEELLAGEEVATCPSCSLIVKVIYDLEAFEQEQNEIKTVTEDLKKEMSRGGRGGGRGGRGGGTSFSREQLNAMGLTGNDMMPCTVNQPPPLYPILDRKPLPLTSSVETDYLLLLKQVNIDHMQLSPYYIKLPTEKTSQPEQEIDKLVAQLPSIKEKYDWRLFPSELRPKLYVKRVEILRNKNVDVAETLKKLEEKEQTGTKESTKVEEKDDLNEELEDEFDEEMDDGTDYANNYFDNGEDYEDNDDNLDDGPIF